MNDNDYRIMIQTAMETARTGGRERRHPADVTADRLVDDYRGYYRLIDDTERTAFGLVIQALREIAEGQR